MVNELINLNDKNRIPIFLTIVVIVLIMTIGFTAQQREEINIVERGVGRFFQPLQKSVTRVMAMVEENLVTLIKSS